MKFFIIIQEQHQQLSNSKDLDSKCPRSINLLTLFLATMICTMAETDKSLFKAILGPILPYFTEALVTGLSIPDDSHFTDTGLKMAVLKGKFGIFY